MRRAIAVVIGVVGLVALIVLLIAVKDNLAFLSFFIADALWVSVLVSILALIVANISGLVQTRTTNKEMEKARKADFLPIIRVQLAFTPALVLRVSNVGKGPALNIDIEITYSPDCKRRWLEPSFAEKETLRILLPGLVFPKQLPEIFPEIRVAGAYEDVFEQKYLINEIINTKQFIDETAALQPISDSNEIVQAIVAVGREVQSLSCNINSLKPKQSDTIRETSNENSIKSLNTTLEKIKDILESIDCKIQPRSY